MLFRREWTVWALVGVGVLVGAGSAWAADDKGSADSAQVVPDELCCTAGTNTL